MFKFHKPTNLKMIFLCILIRLVFSFYISYTSNALIKMVEILFSKEKAP